MTEKYRTLTLLGLLLLIGLGVMGLLVRGGPGETIEIVPPAPTLSPSKELKVYVTGAVKQPGVYAIKEGDRLEDAIKAAGGAAQDADLERVNLAARAKDAQQIYIPRLGESSSSPSLLTTPQKINLNTAPKGLLDTLPGVGETRAENIIESRTKEPFTDPKDLVTRKLVPTSVFEQIKDMVTVD